MHLDEPKEHQSMENQTVQIQIMGRQLQVNCPPDQEQTLIQAAEEFNTRVQDLREKTNITNSEQLLMFAALNTCYELNSLKEIHEETKETNEELQQQVDTYKSESESEPVQKSVATRIDLLQQAIEEALVKHELNKNS